MFFSFCSGSHWRGHQWSGGDPGCSVIRLLIFPVPFPAETFAGTRTLVLSAHVPFSLLLLLQELCLHYGALLVRVLLWVLGTGWRFILRLKKKKGYLWGDVITFVYCDFFYLDCLRPILHHSLQYRIHIPACVSHGHLRSGKKKKTYIKYSFLFTFYKKLTSTSNIVYFRMFLNRGV